ncbi:hypothetical protein N5V81_13385 [Escherichia coli]|nr:hypothetical protein [Escherichia coli]
MMRFITGLLYGVAGPGPEGGHGDLPDVDQAGGYVVGLTAIGCACCAV